ncbi:MAG: ATP-binding protein [Deltaproteobacteria bacterium]
MKTLKYKLVWILIATSVIPLFVTGVISVFFLGQMGLTEAHNRIESNLDIALSVYQSRLDNLKFVARDANRRISVLMDEDQIDLLRNEFTNYCRANNLDFLQVTDKEGVVLVSISNPAEEGVDLATDRSVKRALRFQTSAGTQIAGIDELERLGLTEQALLSGRKTPGLIMKATMPIVNRNEIIIGTMQTGYLLNNDKGHVLDAILKRTGLESSLFLGNLRVATTIQPAKGRTIPVGELFDSPKTNSVLSSGRRFTGRVPIAGKAYRAGYTAIYDPESSVIGMLGVALPEHKVFLLRDRLIGFFAIAVILAIILSFSFGEKKASRIVNSVKKLRSGIEAFGRGDLMYRADIHSGDELEELGSFFNKTMEELMMAKRQIEDFSVNIYRLENKVQKSEQQLDAAQKRLVECERMAAMGRMATALSHELRNTFAEINGGIYNLKQKLAKSDPGLVDAAREINDSLDNATRILTSVLNFSYPKKPILSSVDLNYLIDDLLSMPVIKDMFRRNGVRVEKTVSGSFGPITADGLQLREMLSNLVVNGVQAMPEGGKLSVSLEGYQGFIQIKITDTGTGMPQETLKELFTPFFTTKSRGLGLGLCISKTIIEEHGGQIQVYSSPGKGTTFVISLPVTSKQEAAHG